VTGADRYTDALAELREYHTTGSARSLQEAMVNATLAGAAATALQAILPLVGNDASEVTEWAQVILPSLRDVSTRLSESENDADRLRELLADIVTEFVADGRREFHATATVEYLNMLRDAARLPLVTDCVEATAHPQWWPPKPGDVVRVGVDGDRWATFADGRLACLSDDINGSIASKISADEFFRRFGDRMEITHRASDEVPF
jgi:hypothetical protein